MEIPLLTIIVFLSICLLIGILVFIVHRYGISILEYLDQCALIAFFRKHEARLLERYREKKALIIGFTTFVAEPVVARYKGLSPPEPAYERLKTRIPRLSSY